MKNALWYEGRMGEDGFGYDLTGRVTFFKDGTYVRLFLPRPYKTLDTFINDIMVYSEFTPFEINGIDLDSITWAPNIPCIHHDDNGALKGGVFTGLGYAIVSFTYEDTVQHNFSVSWMNLTSSVIIDMGTLYPDADLIAVRPMTPENVLFSSVEGSVYHA